jgi:type I restriction enzyme S subunit
MQQKSELPEGWIETPFEQILLLLESGSRPKGGVRGILEGIPSIGGEHLNENGGFRFDNVKFVPELFFEKMNKGFIQSNDILIVKDGATTGKTSIVRTDFPYDKAVVNEHVFLCRPFSIINPFYIFYFLFSEIGQKRILSNFRGSAQGGINKSFAPNTIIPLPPQKEQNRIVSAIENVFVRLDASNERLDKIPEIMKVFRQAVLTAAFDGTLTEEWRVETNTDKCSWKWEKINEIGVVSGGLTKNQKRLTYPLSLPYLRVANVYANRLDLSEIKEIGVLEKELNRVLLQKGDLLVVEGNGSIDQIGRVALWDGSIDPCLHQNHLIKVRFSQDVYNKYVLYWLLSPIGRQNIISSSSSTSGLHTLSITKVSNLPVPIPSFSEQEEIVRRVESLFFFANSVEAKLVAAKEKTEQLRKSILVKAFSGELVPTEAELARQDGGDYESAEVLLERIKKERTKSKVSNKSKRKGTSKLLKKDVKDIKDSKTESKHLTLYEILRSSQKPLTPKELWKLSEFEIDDFYAQLKIEVEKGKILERRPTDFEVLLETKK